LRCEGAEVRSIELRVSSASSLTSTPSAYLAASLVISSPYLVYLACGAPDLLYHGTCEDFSNRVCELGAAMKITMRVRQ
jgi:hypothetical protein